MYFESLFSEGRIGRLKIKNRIVMPPMGTMLAGADGEVTDHQIRYFEERAKGGVGLIITEVTAVDYELGKTGASHPRVDDNRFNPMLNRLADTIHKHGAKVFMQLTHAGRQTSSMLLGGKQPVAPSAIPCKLMREKPRVLTLEEIEGLVEKFALGALRCQMSGIDGVELHAAHGYLINQFLSPHTNLRDDEYGGSFSNRMRFLEDIVKSIRALCGENYPVIVRCSVDEFVDGGIDLEMGKRIVKRLEKAGVDALDISAGIYESLPKVIEPMSYQQGWRIHLAEAIKEVVDIPVITVGVIREPGFAESVVKEGKADFVAIGRGLVADPNWARKAEEGRIGDIRKCISCNHCIDGAFLGRHIACSVNARAGRELEFPQPAPANRNEKVVIIGGGPAGLESARILKKRGFQVVLFEEQEELGGKLGIAAKPPGKEKILWLKDYLIRQVEKEEIDVRLGAAGSLEAVKKESPRFVVLAAGASASTPNVKGINDGNVYTAEDVLLEKVRIEQSKVAVIGGGSTGCETAHFLARLGNAVTIVEMKPTVADDVGAITKMDLMEELSQEKVEILTSLRLIEKSGPEILLESMDGGEEVRRSFDKIVMALGQKSERMLADSFFQNFNNVQMIGDFKGPGRIADAIKGGFETAYLLGTP